MTAETIAQERVYNKPDQVTNRLGATGQHNWHQRSAEYIQAIVFYTLKSNNTFCGMVIQFNNGAQSHVGETSSGVANYASLTFTNDSIRQIQVRVVSDVIVAMYVQTTKGNEYITPGNEAPTTADDWQIVTGKEDDIPPQDMILTAISSSQTGNQITSIKFYYKTDVVLYQAVTDVVYDAWNVPQLTTLDGVSTSTAVNNTSEAQTMVITFSESLSESLSLDFTAGVKVGSTVKGSVGIPLVANGEVSASVETSVEFHVGGVITNTKGFDFQSRVVVDGNQTVVARMSVTSYRFTGNFTSQISDVFAHAGPVSRTATGTAVFVSGHDAQVTFDYL